MVTSPRRRVVEVPPSSRPVPPPAEPPAPAPIPPAAAPGMAPSAAGAAAPGVSAPVVQPGSRQEQFDALAAEAAQCFRCGLSQGRQNVVFGSGNREADLMFIGEGPGAQEDLQGLPFVGPAGALLTRIIAAIEMQRGEVYICNMVKCRPPNNRDPAPEEVSACRPFLERQIDLVRPKAIVALGRVAAQALLGTSESLGRLRGRWHTVSDVPTRVTYHPAALLRNAQWKRPTWEDMQIVRDFLRAQNP